MPARAPPPLLSIVAYAVADCPTCTERLTGNIALSRVGGDGHPSSVWLAKSKTLPPVPACRHLPKGSTAIAGTIVTPRSLLLGLQVMPPSVLLKTPDWFVPA